MGTKELELISYRPKRGGVAWTEPEAFFVCNPPYQATIPLSVLEELKWSRIKNRSNISSVLYMTVWWIWGTWVPSSRVNSTVHRHTYIHACMHTFNHTIKWYGMNECMYCTTREDRPSHLFLHAFPCFFFFFFFIPRRTKKSHASFLIPLLLFSWLSSFRSFIHCCGILEVSRIQVQTLQCKNCPIELIAKLHQEKLELRNRCVSPGLGERKPQAWTQLNRSRSPIESKNFSSLLHLLLL